MVSVLPVQDRVAQLSDDGRLGWPFAQQLVIERAAPRPPESRAIPRFTDA
jgi:hypothetical protein